MKKLLASLTLLTLISSTALAQPGYPPIPPPQAEPGPPPPSPGARYILVPGHWHWNGVTYDHWIRTHWVIRRAGWGHFVPGAWVAGPHGWRWIPEHWVP
jgi:hypothetical protein